MASRGITLVSYRPDCAYYLTLMASQQFFVACEPALSGYSVSHPRFISPPHTDSICLSMPPTSTKLLQTLLLA
jgi:hypothetical protein